MAHTFVIEKATKVTLRGKYNTSGKLITVYLDWGSGKNRGFDFIPDRIHANPKTPAEKEHNEAILSAARKRLSLKNVELLSDKKQLLSKLSHVDFMTFFKVAVRMPKENGKPKRESSIVTYESAMESMCEKVIDLNQVLLRDIDKDFVKEFRSKILTAGYSHNTASLYYQWFTSFLMLAHKNEYMANCPSIAVPTITPEGTNINYIFHEDIQKLKDAKCPDPVLKRAGLFASQTGMRSGDLKKLKWGRIYKMDDLYRIVLKQEKTDKAYTIHFRDDVMNILGEPGGPDDLVFPGFHNGGVTNARIETWFSNARINPRGLPDENFTMHDFRHTFAITLGLNGADIYQISQLLGHADIRTTIKHYARILEQLKQKIVLNLPSLK